MKTKTNTRKAKVRDTETHQSRQRSRDREARRQRTDEQKIERRGWDVDQILVKRGTVAGCLVSILYSCAEDIEPN